jgi:two-component system cell cycle response regulator
MTQSNLKLVEDITGCDILIVDDHVQNTELLQAYLEVLSCNVRVAIDGVEALEQVEVKHPDLILLDIMMPRLSGFEVCQRIKDDPATENISILIVTALAEMGDVEKGIDCGADDFLTKPVNKFELLTRVKSLLRVRLLKSNLERTLQYIKEIEKEELKG